MIAFLKALRKMFRSASHPSAWLGVRLRLESLEERCVPSMTQITNASSPPASAIVAVVSVFPDGKIDGTGAVVDADHVLTAGHMIYDPAYGGWATQIVVFAGTTSGTSYVASAYATLGRVEPAFYNTVNWNNDLGEDGAGVGDLGLLTLGNSMGNVTGHFDLGITTNGGSNWTGANLYTMGYPEPLTDGFEMFQQYGPISGAVNAGHYESGVYTFGAPYPLGFQFQFGYFDFSQSNIQEEPAESGSPLFGYDFGQPTIYGVMSGANPSTGYAEQITGLVYNDLQSWMDADNMGTSGVSPSEAHNFLAPAVLQTQTTLQASASGPVSYGQPVTFTAYVSTPDAPCPPTGSNVTGETVSFYDNGTLLGTGGLIAASPTEDSASFTTSTLSVGSHSITAIYNGFAVSGGILFQRSTSGADTGTVVKGETTTDLTGPTSAITAGQPATFTAYVSGAASYPTGTVTFYDGGTMLGTAQLSPYSDVIVPIASASFTTSALGAGGHSITAVYSGDSHFAGSTSAAVTETVPIFVVSSAPGAGVMLYDSTTGWQQLTTANASLLAVNASGRVAAEFPGYGVDLYSGGAWKSLTPANATLLDIDGNGDVVAEFPGYGLQRYRGGVWMSLTPANATLLAVNAGGDAAAEFPGYGVFLYNASTGAWINLTPANASLLAIANNGDVFADLIAAGGVYELFSPMSNKLLIPLNPTVMTADGEGDLFADFTGYGVQELKAGTSSFIQLSKADASILVADANGNLAADFPGYGVSLFEDNLSWGSLTAADALVAAIGG